MRCTYHDIFQPTQQALKLIRACLVLFEEVAPILIRLALLHFLLVLFAGAILWRGHIHIHVFFKSIGSSCGLIGSGWGEVRREAAQMWMLVEQLKPYLVSRRVRGKIALSVLLYKQYAQDN
jgi:hypothetical protein